MTVTEEINQFIEENTKDNFGSVLGYVRTRDALNIALVRLKAAEARAAQLETDNDEMQSYINEIRVALHTEKDELTIDAVRRVISERDKLRATLNGIKVNTIMPDGTRLSDSVIEVMHERNELRAKLDQERSDLRIACNETDDDVTRLSWLQSLITSVLPFIELISGGDVNAGMMCISEVQSLHDDLQKLVSKKMTA